MKRQKKQKEYAKMYFQQLQGNIDYLQIINKILVRI